MDDADDLMAFEPRDEGGEVGGTAHVQSKEGSRLGKQMTDDSFVSNHTTSRLSRKNNLEIVW